MIHYSLADEELNLSVYSDLPKTDAPCIILGTVIKHRYDEERLSFNNINGLKAVNVHGTIIKGIELQSKADSNIDLLFAQLKAISDENLYVEFYENMLQSFGMSSSECYGTLRAGVYPINNEHISKITTSTTSITDYYNQLFANHEECSWQKFSYLSLFVLLNKS